MNEAHDYEPVTAKQAGIRWPAEVCGICGRSPSSLTWLGGHLRDPESGDIGPYREVA